MEFLPLLILAVVVVVIAIRLAVGGMDRDRIAQYVRNRRGRVVSTSWAPFGKGWFGERNDRIYEVVYYDERGDQHMATCKTSLFAGVYFTENRVSHPKAAWQDRLSESDARGEPMIRSMGDAPPRPATAEEEEEDVARLREENDRLRQEIERLKRG